ncbi:hypothetical protein MnTg02_03334 [bacterium MnTg02]|nr:hypothetical protein MnTg02_03334 [bacterium MnTg02]
MRILRIDLPASLKSNNAQINLSSGAVREQFRREMDSLKDELSEIIRHRASAYFPSDYTVYVRISFLPETNGAKTIIWVDDPNVRWPAALFARRAWALSIPILSHIIKETFEERVQSVSMQIDDKKARITSFAPIRGWNDPVILTAGVLILSGFFWYLVNWFLQDGLSSLIGY